MKQLLASFLITFLLVLFGCDGVSRDSAQVAAPGTSSEAPSARDETLAGAEVRVGTDVTGISLSQISAVQASTVAAEHKIIRNADLIIETESPSDGMRQITEIAESLGGFVVTSEMKHNDARARSRPSQVVTAVIRVPSAQFAVALERIRGVGSSVLNQKISGQDVTEEYLDVEARIRTKKALEAQFMEIMKQARNVSDALEVQSQLANVRTEIEQLEGRKRFLENKSSLSTINVTLQMPAPIVEANTSSFTASIKEAAGDGVDLTASIFLGLIRLVIVLVPVGLFIILPLGLLVRALLRRIHLPRAAQTSSLNSGDE